MLGNKILLLSMERGHKISCQLYFVYVYDYKWYILNNYLLILMLKISLFLLLYTFHFDV